MGKTTMTQTDMIVAVLGDMLFDKDYFFNKETNEVFYWNGEYRVVTPLEDFINLSYEKWATTKTE